MLNIDTFFAKYDYESIIDEILANNKVEKDDDHIKRHRVELKKKIEDVTKKLKESNLLRDLPVLDNEFFSYVIRIFTYLLTNLLVLCLCLRKNFFLEFSFLYFSL